MSSASWLSLCISKIVEFQEVLKASTHWQTSAVMVHFPENPFQVPSLVRVLMEDWINEKLSTEPKWEMSDIMSPEEQQSKEI